MCHATLGLRVINKKKIGACGFGFRIQGFGFQVLEVSGFGFRVSGFGFRVSGFGFRVSGLGSRVSGFGSQVPGSMFQDSGSEFRVSKFGYQNSGFGFRVSGLTGGGRSIDKLAGPGPGLGPREDLLVGNGVENLTRTFRAIPGTSLPRFKPPPLSSTIRNPTRDSQRPYGGVPDSRVARAGRVPRPHTAQAAVERTWHTQDSQG